MRRPAAWLVYLLWMVVLSGAYGLAHFFGPEWLNSGPVYNVIGLSPIGALLGGVRRRPRDRRLPWLLAAAGQTLFVAGDVLAYNYQRFFGSALPFPSIADAFYLGYYPLLLAALLLLIRESGTAGEPGGIVDALTITLGAGTLSWTFLMSPYARDSTLSLSTKLISIAYPLMDVLVLGVLVGFVMARGTRSASLVVLVGGMTMLLATDAVYGWMLLHGGYETGGVLDLGWAAFYALIGVAALHPSSRAIRTPDPRVPGPGLTVRRIALLGSASLIAPVIMLTRGLPGDASLDVKVLAAASAAMFVLVLVRMAGVMRSREAAVRREAERSAELAAAERSARAKDTFVSQVSHELRTPLTSILGYLSLLQEEGPSEPTVAEKAAYLTIVVRNTDRLTRLVDDLLLLARMDDGRFALEQASFDLAETAAQAVEAARPAAVRHGVALSLRTPDTLRLRGDSSRIAQVIDNLLSNAIKFTPESGQVDVEITRENGTAALAVTDTGPGIRPDEVEHLFERFYRTDAATASAIQGTGLGLSIAKAIVEAHGGSIAVASRPGHGTSMTVELPVDVD